MDEKLPLMSETSQQALKEVVTDKLKEMDLYQDDVLPQYICVMVKNQKTPNEIKEQLTFFVGEETNMFVNWLYECITKGTYENAAKKRLALPEDDESRKRSRPTSSADNREGGLEDALAVNGADKNNGDGETKDKRPCQFFPNCRNGASCPFVHPDPSLLSRDPKRPCANFPACPYGDQCTFKHPRPDCRFGQSCQNMTCHFNHPDAAGMPGYGGGFYGGSGGGFASGKGPVCKFGPNCTNPSCHFYHAPVCKFGARCTNPNCQFSHDASSKDKSKTTCKFGDSCTKNECPFYHPTIGGPKHISDRVFVLEEEDGDAAKKE